MGWMVQLDSIPIIDMLVAMLVFSLLISQSLIAVVNREIEPSHIDMATRILRWLIISGKLDECLRSKNPQKALMRAIKSAFPNLRVNVYITKSKPLISRNSIMYFSASRKVWVVIEVVE